MKLPGRRRFPIKLRDDKRRVVATVEEGQEEFRFELRSTEVDLRPLDGMEGLRLIEVVTGDHLDSYRAKDTVRKPTFVVRHQPRGEYDK